MARNRVIVKWGLVIPGSSLHRGLLYGGTRYIGARTGVFVTWGLVMPGFSLRGARFIGDSLQNVVKKTYRTLTYISNPCNPLKQRSDSNLSPVLVLIMN